MTRWPYVGPMLRKHIILLTLLQFLFGTDLAPWINVVTR